MSQRPVKNKFLFFASDQNDPQMSQMMVDEEELKARETEKAGNDLGRPSIGGNEQVPFTYGPNKLECLSPASISSLV